MAKKPKPPAHPLHPLTPAQTWWLLATGIAAYAPLAPQVPLWLAAVAAGAFAWRAALAWWRQPLPPRWLLILVTLAGTAAVLVQYRTLFGQQAGVALLLVFMALKQLEARAPRDGLAVVLLAYFLTLAQFFEDQSIPVAATMLGTVLVATAALANLADAQGHPLRLFKLAGTMLLQAVPFMLILFVLFPRVQGPLWGLPRDAYSGLTGLSDTMSPGAINHLVQSDAIAFRVNFAGAVPPKKELYWRGPVLSLLDGSTWRQGISTIAREQPYAPLAGSPTYTYAVTLEPHNKPWLFALELPETLPPEAFRMSDFQLQAKKPVRERLRYEATSRTQVQQHEENAFALGAARRLPAGLNPRTVELGAGWTADGSSDVRRVERAIDFMRRQQLIYTSRPPLMNQHVTDEFLFDQKHGFCEHFAAAFVVLMRAADVPARVVTGYQGGERNPVDDTWVIRQSDAHAWAEVWLEGRGWVRVDPTATSAPARIEENLAAAVPAGDPLPFFAGKGLDWLRDVRFRWWAINNAWNQWVLGFNPERQLELLARLGMESPDWRKMTAWLAGLTGLMLLALAGGLLWRRPHLDPAQREWQRAIRRLEKRGLPRRPWEGPQDYAARVAAEIPAAADDIRAIAALYAGLRYGTLPDSSCTTLRQRVVTFQP
jgi:transglutaminase-like putative cysteine protease